MYHIIRGCDAMGIMVRKRAEHLCHMQNAIVFTQRGKNNTE